MSVKRTAAPQKQYGVPRKDAGVDVNGGEDDDEAGAVFQDFSTLTLRKHHETKPIWVCPNLRIYLEAFNPLYQYAYDFLIAICEPVARPSFVHEYKLTSYSLYAAVAVNIQTDHILDTLTRFSKNELPREVVSFIRKSTETYGKAKLLLRENEYYIEAESKAVATTLLKEPAIKAARVVDDETGGGDDDFIEGEAAQEMTANIEYLMVGREEDEDDQDPSSMFGESKKTAIFKIAKDQVRKVKEAALTMDPPYPLMEEYDFRKDSKNPALIVTLKPTNKLRNYQEKSLNMFFGNGRARSGIIVLPCGAGKTLTGVTAAATIQKGVIVLANTNVSALQWRAQFKQWTSVTDDTVIKFTSKDSQILPQKPVILITTYSMLSYTGRRNETVRRILEQIRGREWGLMILDEVHVAPANSFQAILDQVSAHSKLGLTATLVREDNLIDSLNSMIGPKLYEANWMDLTEKGHLANVQCVEAWCPMTSEFFQEYLRVAETYKDGKLQKKAREILYLMNPNKIRVCEYLMRYHEARGDKIIIFSDSVFALKQYSRLFNRPAIYGGTKEKERENILAVFRISATTNTILLSRVGDTSIDLPEANVIIQVSSHFGSRRQEAQRLGRILRPKQTADEGFNAFFYTLVCTDTVEMRYSTKRQQYLVDQGYTYKVIPDLVKDAMENLPKDPNSSKMGKREELELLAQATNSINSIVDEDTNEEVMIRNAEEDEDLQYGNEAASSAAAKRKSSSMAAISGGDGLNYMEYEARGSGATQKKSKR